MSLDRPLLIVTKEGYQAVITVKDNEYQATIINRSIPQCLHLIKTAVAFAPSYTTADLRKGNRHWQRTHIQLQKFNNSQILYVGKLGLHGGGSGPSIFHHCWFSSCQPYRCDRCNYTCPNGACLNKCDHRFDHLCASRQANQRRKLKERQERVRRAQAEHERQERIIREQAEQMRLHREREARERKRQEQLREHREREEQERRKCEKQARLKKQREHEEQERERQRVERKRQEQIRRKLEELEKQKQQEREARERKVRERKAREGDHQEQLRIQRERTEREYQERIRREHEERKRQKQQREREEKETITKKLDDALLAMSAIQETEADYVSEDEETKITKETNSTEANVSHQKGHIENVEEKFDHLSPDFAVIRSRFLFESIGVEEDLTTNVIDESVRTHDDVLLLESWFKTFTLDQHDMSSVIFSLLKQLEKNVSADLARMVDAKLRLRYERESHRNKKQTTEEENQLNKCERKNKRKHRQQERREDAQRLVRQTLKANAFQQLSQAVRRNLRKVRLELAQSILHYINRGGKLQVRVVKRFPVFKWIEQSLIVELVSSSDGSVDAVLLEVFRNHWLAVENLFTRQQQLEMLYALRTKQLRCKLMLNQINDVLSMVCKLENKGLDIMCHKEDFEERMLKRCWIKNRSTRKDFDEETMNDLIDKLVELPWNSLMLEQFLVYIDEVSNQQMIKDFVKMIVEEQVAYTIVMRVLTTQALEKDSCVQYWIQELKYQLFIYWIYKRSPSIAYVVDEKLGEPLRTTSMGPVLKGFIEENVTMLEGNATLLTTVLEQATTYQMSANKWDDVFNVLRQENPKKWVEEVDKLIVSDTFGHSYEYSLEDLIKQISQGAPEVMYAQQDNLKKSFDALRSAYNSTYDGTLQKMTQKPISNWNDNDIKLWASFVKSSPNATSQEEMIAVIRRAVERCHKFSPRTVQLLSLLVLANPAANHGRLAQINTGEGKSVIVAMLAALHALTGVHVDVVTTSTELSIPEVNKQRPFFELLNLTVDENSPERDKKAVYSCDVVYGTAANFQGDVLRTEFLGKECRRNRQYQVVIVDEVDSMLFDSRTHSIRLADECPGMNHLEVPLAVIWEHIHSIHKRMISMHGNVYFIAEDFEVLPGQQIQLYSGGDWKEVAIKVEDKHKFIAEHTEKHLSTLLRSLADEEQAEYKAYQEMNLQILRKEEDLSKIDENDQKPIRDECDKLHKELVSLAWNKRDPVIDIPEYLRSFALKQIPIWVNNAILAEWAYKKDAHYTVMDNRIVPVNFNETGDLQINMIWSDGLTQFLQIKEGLRMDPEGVSTNFISNVSYFQRYGSKIYGLTGTLGEKSTRDFFHTLYGTDIVVIPPHNYTEISNNSKSSYRCKELAPLVFSKQGNWYNSVKENTLYHAQNQRAVLVICKFISQVKYLSHMLRKVHDSNKIFIYTGAEVNFQKDTIDSGEIVIATNIAGRGTDLKTTKNVEKHGGLCVLVTFLPESFRVEMQNVGRTGREGKRGMAQLIVLDQDGTSLETLKKNRFTQETQATAKAIDDASKMIIQDFLFQIFCQLENEILSSYDETRKVQDLNKLVASWAQYSYNKLDSRKMGEKTMMWSSETINKYYNTALETLTEEERSKLSKEDLQRFREKAAKQVATEASNFRERYQQTVMDSFVSMYSQDVTPEALQLFTSNKTETVEHEKLSQRFGWTCHERKGAEESWGLWLKGCNFNDTDITVEQAMTLFKTGFEEPFRQRANEDKLIQNPFFYVLKGNDMLETKKIDEAIDCFDRAIELDPLFSVNAHYNKAQALLCYSENKGDKQHKALIELNKAKDLIETVHRPNLLTFNTLITQHSCKGFTSQHVQCQLDILSKQEDFIENACQVIATAQRNKNNVKITLKTITETFTTTQEDHAKAIQEANINGFRNLFTVEEKLPRPWKEIWTVALIGLTQIASGCLIVAYTGGDMGKSLIVEGVSDLITTFRSAITGSFSWTAWASHKVISLSVSIVSSGINIIKQTIKAAKKSKFANIIKQAGSNIYDKITTILEDGSRTSYDIGKGIVTPEQGVSLAVQEVGIALGKGAFKECLHESIKYSTDILVLDGLEDEITARIDDVLTRTLQFNQLVIKAFEEDEKTESSYWKDKFTKLGMELLNDKKLNKCTDMLGKIAKGVATGTIPYAETVMEAYDVVNCLQELDNFAERFLARFIEKLEQHEKQINQKKSWSEQHIAAQLYSQAPEMHCEDTEINVETIDTATSYSSRVSPADQTKLRSEFREPSTPETLIKAFKRTIVAKLTASIRDNLVNTFSTKVTTHMTNKLFSNVEQSVAQLREKIKFERDLHSASNAMANATLDITDKSIEAETHTQFIIKTVTSTDYLHDTTSLALSSATVQAPVHVYDNKGNLKYILGSKQPGKPIALKHFAPSVEHPLGHFTPLDPNIEVARSENNTCALDSVIAQLSFAQRESLQVKDAADLRNRIIEQILANPHHAEDMYKKRALLEKIAPNRIIFGGRPVKELRIDTRVKKFNKKHKKYNELFPDRKLSQDSGSMDIATTDLTQEHHLIHQQFFRNPIHKALSESGFRKNEAINVLVCPKTEEIRKKLGTSRSVHRGPHPSEVVEDLGQKLDFAYNQYQKEKRSKEWLYQRVVKIAHDERRAVRSGLRLLTSNQTKDSNEDPK